MSVAREALAESECREDRGKVFEDGASAIRGGAAYPCNADVQGVVAEGLARLLDGQRRFAEEFGLQYGRVFQDGYESFKGRDSVALIQRWLSGHGDGPGSLEALFHDLAAHQVALLSAVDSAVCEAVDQAGAKKPFWVRALRRLGFRKADGAGSVSDRRVSRQLSVVTPALVWGYVQARQAIDESR